MRWSIRRRTLANCDTTIAAIRQAGWQPEIRAASRAPWSPQRCVEIRAGATVLGHAGQLAPEALAAFDLPAGLSAMEIDLDALTSTPRQENA